MAEFDLTAEITSALKDWSGDIADGLDELVDEEAKALKQDIVNDSPERTGDYKKAGRLRKSTTGAGIPAPLCITQRISSARICLKTGTRGRMAGMCRGIRI